MVVQKTVGWDNRYHNLYEIMMMNKIQLAFPTVEAIHVVIIFEPKGTHFSG
jgi:hypothetical protein